ncbi:MAG: class I SAM-dependent methyltransferase [Candidatus Eisenbacteria bacterium]|nr:class I SAM-dependent methyltransferase [Candidatus Eisenbacteria bacterium]
MPGSAPHAGPVPDDAILREIIARAVPGVPELPQFHSLAGARQYRHLYRMVRRHVPAGARVLDWGTGSGHFSYFLTRAGYRATGFSIAGVSHAAWLGEPYERFVGGNATDPVTLPFESGSFDAVASVGVLEHVRETGGSEAASLDEIARVLVPGGAFLCYHFPNRTSWVDFAARRVPGRHHHVHRYGRADIEGLVRAAGLELVEARRYGFLPRNSLHRVPGPLREARWAADLWDALDAGLGALLSPLCQNWAFVARKPAR